MLIFINGSLLPENEAKVSVFDRGFLYGDGVFETLRAYRGAIFRCDDHIERLFRSAAGIHVKIPFPKDFFKDALYKTLRENRLQDAYLRLALTRGESAPGLDIEGCSEPTVVIIPREFSGYPEDLYKNGISAAIVNIRRIPPAALSLEIKSLNFLNNIMARVEASGLGASEGIMLGTDGHVAEGTVSNIFIVKNGIIKTPPLSVGILNGVTRSIVVGLAGENNIPVTEHHFYPDELYSADECFITSTLYEIMPITSLDSMPVGNGLPGEVTRRLIEFFRTLTSV